MNKGEPGVEHLDMVERDPHEMNALVKVRGITRAHHNVRVFITIYPRLSLCITALTKVWFICTTKGVIFCQMYLDTFASVGYPLETGSLMFDHSVYMKFKDLFTITVCQTVVPSYYAN